MFKLVLLSKLVPTSTASVERAFSLMNSLCTTNRNRLGQETLSSLMLICDESHGTLSEEEKQVITDNFKAIRPREISL